MIIKDEESIVEFLVDLNSFLVLVISKVKFINWQVKFFSSVEVLKWR